MLDWELDRRGRYFNTSSGSSSPVFGNAPGIFGSSPRTDPETGEPLPTADDTSVKFMTQMFGLPLPQTQEGFEVTPQQLLGFEAIKGIQNNPFASGLGSALQQSALGGGQVNPNLFTNPTAGLQAGQAQRPNIGLSNFQGADQLGAFQGADTIGAFQGQGSLGDLGGIRDFTPGGAGGFNLNDDRQQFLDQIQAQTQGQSALRGGGQAGQTALAGAIAPALMQFRQQDIQNQMAQQAQTLQARGQDIQSALGAREQNLGARGQDLSSFLGARGQDVSQRGQTLSSLLGARGQNVDARGQDLSSLLGARGQDAQIQQTLANMFLGEQSNLNQLFGQQSQNALGGRNALLQAGQLQQAQQALNFKNLLEAFGGQQQNRQFGIERLMELAGLANPQALVGSQSSQSSFGVDNPFKAIPLP